MSILSNHLAFHKRRAMRFLRRWVADESGVAYIELASTLMTMVVIFFGIVELTSYIKMKNKINQAADHLAEALSTMPYWSPKEQFEPLLPASDIIMQPFGGQVSIAFCSGVSGTRLVAEQTYRGGNCSVKANVPSSGTLEKAACDDATLGGVSMVTARPTTQYVVVAVSCRYTPTIESLAMFGDWGVFKGLAVTARTVKPIRYHMQWDELP